MKLNPEIEQQLQKLRSLPDGSPVLSVYLETQPGLALHHGHVSQLMDTLRESRQVLDETEQAAFAEEAERVLAFVREEYVPQGKSLVIFASHDRSLWEVMSLQLALGSRARFAPAPYLVPIDVALEDYPRIAVVLVNQERARFITTILGEIEDESRLADDVPGKQRQGGWAAFKYESDRLQHVREHFANVVEELSALEQRLPYKWLVLGGTEQATSAVKHLLPERLAAKLAGSFNDEQFELDSVIAQQATRIAEQAERAEELSVAREIVDRAMAGGRAALGWDETLQCLSEGRVHLLAVAGSRLNTADADKALAFASSSNARIEVIHGEAEAVLAANNGIGGLLRY
jgi:peptide subunit release factor 1 (eRF1)